MGVKYGFIEELLNWSSSINTMTRLWIGWSGFGTQQGQGFFIFTMFRPVLRPLGALTQG